MPSSVELQSYKPFLHCVLTVGYKENKDRVIVLNSRGCHLVKKAVSTHLINISLILLDALTFG